MVYIERIRECAVNTIQCNDCFSKSAIDTVRRWLGMQLHLNMFCTKRLKTALAKHLLDALKQRSENIFQNLIMAAALYLDPRFRREIINKAEKIDQAKKVLLDIWRRVNMLRSNIDSTPTTTTNDDSTENLDFVFDESAAILEHLNGNSVNSVNINVERHQTNDIELLIDLFQPEQLQPNQFLSIGKKQKKQILSYMNWPWLFSVCHRPKCKSSVISRVLISYSQNVVAIFIMKDSKTFYSFT